MTLETSRCSFLVLLARGFHRGAGGSRGRLLSLVPLACDADTTWRWCAQSGLARCRGSLLLLRLAKHLCSTSLGPGKCHFHGLTSQANAILYIYRASKCIGLLAVRNRGHHQASPKARRHETWLPNLSWLKVLQPAGNSVIQNAGKKWQQRGLPMRNSGSRSMTGTPDFDNHAKSREITREAPKYAPRAYFRQKAHENSR